MMGAARRWAGRSLWNCAEALLWCLCVVCGGFLLITSLSARAASREAQQIGHGLAGQGSGAGSHPLRRFGDDPGTATAGKSGGVIGRIEIKKVGMTVPILSDIETPSLLRGAGHVPGTATAGGLGTMALAGHRDTFFRPVRHIEKGMDISVTDAGGTYHYRVDSMEIVSPDQVEVLAIRDRPELALVTCYPFNYIGAAPKRFIVHAHLLSAVADE